MNRYRIVPLGANRWAVEKLGYSYSTKYVPFLFIFRVAECVVHEEWEIVKYHPPGRRSLYYDNSATRPFDTLELAKEWVCERLKEEHAYEEAERLTRNRLTTITPREITLGSCNCGSGNAEISPKNT